MRLERMKINLYGFNEVDIEHKGEVINWSTKVYSRYQIHEDPFKEINRYLETLPDSVHDRMFQIYRELKTSLAIDVKERFVMKKINELYQDIRIEDAKRWLLRQPDYVVPRKENTSYSTHNSRDKTYSEEDYDDLAVFSILMRLLIPVWGTCLGIYNANNTQYPELLVVSTLHGTIFEQCSAFKRLGVYAISMVNNDMSDDEKFNRTLQGLAPTEFARWMRAEFIIKKMVVTQVLGINNKSKKAKTLLTNLYYNIRGIVQPDKRKQQASERLRHKTHPSDDDGGGEEDKSSYLERYKMKQKVIEGDQVLMNYVSQDIRKMVKYVDDTVPDDLIEQAILTARRHEYYPVRNHQIKIAQWVMAPYIKPRAVLRLDVLAMRNTICAARAIVAHWGFTDVAIFMSVEEAVDGVDAAGNRVNAKLLMFPSSSMRAVKEDKDILSKHFPYEITRTSGTKAKDVDANNFALRDIDAILKELTTKAWVYRGDDKLIENSEQRIKVGDFLPVPYEIKLDLMRLVVRCVQ